MGKRTGMNLRNVALASTAGMAALFLLGPMIFQSLGQSRIGSGADINHVQYEERCLTAASEAKPVWECYELTVDDPVAGGIIIRHASGETQHTLSFEDDGEIKFRFTPSRPGHWTFSTGGSINIAAERPDYAKGFVAAKGSNWIRTATGEAFVPQYLMYDRPDLENGLQEFVVEHGFTGFHINHLRDFLQNPGYFEAVVLKTYRLGGVTHFWIWGDESRRQTPKTYGVDAEVLYREIAARLGPLPGWTVGYGFDLFEWASTKEVESFRETLRSHTSYRHMVGARGFKNKYRQLSEDLDYASWEWHQPTLRDYRDHLTHANGSPAFSEDRFRIRQPSRYPEKDYDFDRTRRGLWHAALSGGIANIWGFKPKGKTYSEPYKNKEAIHTYRRTVDLYFEPGMTVNNNAIANAACLESRGHILCYLENTSSMHLKASLPANLSSISVIDTRQPYREIRIDDIHQVVQLSGESDWAVLLFKSTATRRHNSMAVEN